MLLRENVSFPVGKVEFEYLYPLTFDEFLVGIEKELLKNKINQSIIFPYHLMAENHSNILDKSLIASKFLINDTEKEILEFYEILDKYNIDTTEDGFILNSYIINDDVDRYPSFKYPTEFKFTKTNGSKHLEIILIGN